MGLESVFFYFFASEVWESETKSDEYFRHRLQIRILKVWSGYVWAITFLCLSKNITNTSLNKCSHLQMTKEVSDFFDTTQSKKTDSTGDVRADPYSRCSHGVRGVVKFVIPCLRIPLLQIYLNYWGLSRKYIWRQNLILCNRKFNNLFKTRIYPSIYSY